MENNDIEGTKMNEMLERTEVHPPEELNEIKPQKELNDKADTLFAEFGWNSEEFKRIRNENLYKEFLSKESEEFFLEKELYENPELYRYCEETGFEEGPNCYAFAMRWPYNPLTKDVFSPRPSPGELSHGEKASVILSDKIWTENPEGLKPLFSKMMKDDAAICGLSIKEVDKDYKTEAGEWMIALVSTDIRTLPIYELPDFHFYRKGDSGAWYHKKGTTEVTDVDDSGKMIYDPAICNRGNYEAFLGYYAVKAQKGGKA